MKRLNNHENTKRRKHERKEKFRAFSAEGGFFRDLSFEVS